MTGVENRELRQQQADRGLGTAILVRTVFGQAVEAATGLRVVEGNALVVAAEEPFEGEPGATKVGGVGGGIEAGEGGLYHGGCVDWLLIVERRLLGAMAIPAVIADEAERVAHEGLVGKEAHGTSGDVEVLLASRDLVGTEEGLGELRVGVGHFGQEPVPAGPAVLSIADDEVVCERASQLLHSRRFLRPGLKPAVESSDAKGSAPGVFQPRNPGQCFVQHLLRGAYEPRLRGSEQDPGERPHGAAEAILGGDFVERLSLEADEVVEPAVRLPSEHEEGKVTSRELATEIVAVRAMVFDYHDQRAGVVVGGVAGPVVWNRVPSVLYDAEAICQSL